MTTDTAGLVALDAVLRTLPDHSRDVALNVRRVFTVSALSAPRLWGVGLASAVTVRGASLVAAVERDAASAGVSADVLDDARAAASFTSMNNVFYRFRHFLKDDEVDRIPPRFQGDRALRPKGEGLGKADLELFGLAVSAINGCELCVRLHAGAALRGGVSKEEVVESVRVAAVIRAAAVALSRAP